MPYSHQEIQKHVDYLNENIDQVQKDELELTGVDSENQSQVVLQ